TGSAATPTSAHRPRRPAETSDDPYRATAAVPAIHIAPSLEYPRGRVRPPQQRNSRRPLPLVLTTALPLEELGHRFLGQRPVEIPALRGITVQGPQLFGLEPGFDTFRGGRETESVSQAHDRFQHHEIGVAGAVADPLDERTRQLHHL